MNSTSSRSHLVVMLTITGYNTVSKVTTVSKVWRVFIFSFSFVNFFQLTLVDLAGSERVGKVSILITIKKTSSISFRRPKLVEIGSSRRITSTSLWVRWAKYVLLWNAFSTFLSRLIQVFTALRSNSMHVPYRNSKLTYLLQDCIGGDAKTMVFINVSPLEYNVRETISTLQFGQVWLNFILTETESFILFLR